MSAKGRQTPVVEIPVKNRLKRKRPPGEGDLPNGDGPHPPARKHEKKGTAKNGGPPTGLANSKVLSSPKKGKSHSRNTSRDMAEETPPETDGLEVQSSNHVTRRFLWSSNTRRGQQH